MNFGENIIILRKKNGLTQKQFADKLNLSATTVTAWEKGAKKPSYEVLLLIGKQFNVSLDWLCGNSKSDEIKINTWADIIKMLYAISSSTIVPSKKEFVAYDEEDEEENGRFSLSFSKFLVPVRDIFGVVLEPLDTFAFVDYGNLTVINNPIYDFFSQYDKMKKLLDQEAIDYEIFDMWLSKCFEKYDYEIINDCLIEGEPNGNDNKAE